MDYYTSACVIYFTRIAMLKKNNLKLVMTHSIRHTIAIQTYDAVSNLKETVPQKKKLK